MKYCERIGDAFWAEPVNAITNLAFILAAGAFANALHQTQVRARTVWDLWVLTALMLAIGVGSFLWHTLATPWSALADVIPILLFIAVFLLSFLVRIAHLRWPAVLLWFSSFQLSNFGLLWALPPDFLNGSIFYAPTWASLLLMAAYCLGTGRHGRGLLSSAALVFTVSLSLRTLDNALCPLWPLGTHFSWHLLNGLTLYLVTMTLLTTVDNKRDAANRSVN